MRVPQFGVGFAGFAEGRGVLAGTALGAPGTLGAAALGAPGVLGGPTPLGAAALAERGGALAGTANIGQQAMSVNVSLAAVWSGTAAGAPSEPQAPTNAWLNGLQDSFGGNADNLVARGGRGRDNIAQNGNAGNDNLFARGGLGNDRIVQNGGAGNDNLYAFGGKGKDRIVQNGGAGNDTMTIRLGRKKNRDKAVVNGGSGHDVLNLQGNKPVTVRNEQGQVIYQKGKGGTNITVSSVEQINVDGRRVR